MQSEFDRSDATWSIMCQIFQIAIHLGKMCAWGMIINYIFPYFTYGFAGPTLPFVLALFQII